MWPEFLSVTVMELWPAGSSVLVMEVWPAGLSVTVIEAWPVDYEQTSGAVILIFNWLVLVTLFQLYLYFLF